MPTRQPPKGRKSALVWRISAEAPQGQWVDPSKSRSDPPKGKFPEVSYGGWASSSFDLLSGVDISDDPDTVPDALFDEFFPQRRTGRMTLMDPVRLNTTALRRPEFRLGCLGGIADTSPFNLQAYALSKTMVVVGVVQSPYE